MTQRGTPIITQPRKLVIDWLNRIGGEKVSPTKVGLPSQACRDEAGYTGSQTAWPGLLKSMEAEGIISREVNGKRTLAIRLLPPYLDVRLEVERESDADVTVSMETTATVSTEAEPEPELEPDELNVTDDALDQLLDKLLVRVLERLTAKPEIQVLHVATPVPDEFVVQREAQLTRELDDIKGKLATALSEAQRYRRKADEASDAARASSEQATQLRKDKRALEANIKTLTQSSNRRDLTAEEQERETKRLMEAPHIAKGRKAQ